MPMNLLGIKDTIIKKTILVSYWEKYFVRYFPISYISIWCNQIISQIGVYISYIRQFCY